MGRFNISLEAELSRLEARRQKQQQQQQRQGDLEDHVDPSTSGGLDPPPPHTASAVLSSDSDDDVLQGTVCSSSSSTTSSGGRRARGARLPQRSPVVPHMGTTPQYTGSRFDVLNRSNKVDHIVSSEAKKASQRRLRTSQNSIHSCCNAPPGGGGTSTLDFHDGAAAMLRPSACSTGFARASPVGVVGEPPHSSSSSEASAAAAPCDGDVAKESPSSDGAPACPVAPASRREEQEVRRDAAAESRQSIGGSTTPPVVQRFPYACRIPSKAPYRRLLPQPFSHILVLDFEATCDGAAVHYPHEIIEFPVVVLDSRSLEIVAEFHRYVRPVRNPILTSFCTELTGITQEMVDAAPPLPVVLQEFREWLEADVYPLCRAWRQRWNEACDQYAPPPDDVEPEKEERERKMPVEEQRTPQEVSSSLGRKGTASTSSSPLQRHINPIASVPTTHSGAKVVMKHWFPSAGQEVLDEAGLSRNLQSEKKKFALDATHRKTREGAGEASPTTLPANSPATSRTTAASAVFTRATFEEEEAMVCFATDGPWDMRKFMFDCEVLQHQNTFPPLFYRFINVRNCFTKAFKCKQMKLTHMLRKLHMSFEGRRHSGIDDTRNILRVLAELLARGYRVHHVSLLHYRTSDNAILLHEQAANQLLTELMVKNGSRRRNTNNNNNNNNKSKGKGKQGKEKK